MNGPQESTAGPVGVSRAGTLHDAVLLDALGAAPRRYRLPPLPADGAAAAALGADTALAFAIEAARLAKERHTTPSPEARDLFTASLAAVIGEAMARDPGFQALVLRAQDPEVDEYARLAAQAAADRRSVRAAIDAIAHPGKTQAMDAGAMRDLLDRWHGLARAESWNDLGSAIEYWLHGPGAGEPSAHALAAIAASPSLDRLQRCGELAALPAVRRYLGLCAQRGPQAGSAAAAAQGRASARVGQGAEDDTAQAFRCIAALLDRQAQGTAAFRAVRSLRTPRGFPGAQGKAKDEWDVAIVRNDPGARAGEIVLLAEVKASASAAAADFSRLHRGLERLANASATETYAFATMEGEVPLTGASLRALKPHGRAWPPQVIYCCSTPPEPRPQPLHPASKAALLAEAASLAFAIRLARADAAPHADLAPVWQALASAPRLRAALHQHETARAVREAMLQPQDLLAAVRQRVGAP